jgi:hypothetical protein
MEMFNTSFVIEETINKKTAKNQISDEIEPEIWSHPPIRQMVIDFKSPESIRKKESPSNTRKERQSQPLSCGLKILKTSEYQNDQLHMS